MEMGTIEAGKCGDCRFYDSWPEDPTKGRCFLFDSVDPEKRKLYKAGFEAKDPCRYGLAMGEKIELTSMGIFNIVTRSPIDFWEQIHASDIRLDTVIGGLE